MLTWLVVLLDVRSRNRAVSPPQGGFIATPGTTSTPCGLPNRRRAATPRIPQAALAQIRRLDPLVL
jgi:hypothetical protein